MCPPPLGRACPEEDKPAAEGLWCCVRTWTQLARCFWLRELYTIHGFGSLRFLECDLLGLAILLSETRKPVIERRKGLSSRRKSGDLESAGTLVGVWL